MSAFHRPCDNEICIICQKKITLADEGCLITVPSKKLKKFKAATMDQFVFKWKINKPSNPLHFKCWEKHKKLTATEQRVIDSVEDTLERFCTLAQLEKSVDEVVPLLIKSKSTVCFTGAGISTSAGIPDYRGSSGIDNVADHANQSIVVPVEEEEEEEEDVDENVAQEPFDSEIITDEDVLLSIRNKFVSLLNRTNSSRSTGGILSRQTTASSFRHSTSKADSDGVCIELNDITGKTGSDKKYKNNSVKEDFVTNPIYH